MEKVLVRQLFRQTPADGAQLLVSGWVRTVRDSKAFAFIELNDGSFFKNLQIVLDESVPDFREVVKVTLGSAIEVEGTLEAGSFRDEETGFISQLRLRDARFRTL